MGTRLGPEVGTWLGPEVGKVLFSIIFIYVGLAFLPMYLFVISLFASDNVHALSHVEDGGGVRMGGGGGLSSGALWCLMVCTVVRY